jgi:hypothetical protein
MSQPTSFADQTRDWQGLLQAFLDNATTLAAADPQRQMLELSLAKVLEIKARQDSHAAVRQQTTQELEEAMREGREHARRLRGMAKGILGTKNERLVQFKVAPIRSRPRKTRKPEVTPTPTSTE